MVGEMPRSDRLSTLLMSTALIWFGVLQAALVFGKLGSLLQSSDHAATSYREKKEAMMKFMSMRHVPKPLQRRVLAHMDATYERNRGMDDGVLLCQLPTHLREDMGRFLNRNLIAGFTLFIMCELKTVVCYAVDTLCREGDYAEELYILLAGSVVVFRNGQMKCELGVGSFFGLAAVLEEGANLRNATVVAVSMCEYVTLSRDGLQDLFKRFPYDADHIRKMHPRILQEASQDADGLETVTLLTSDGAGDDGAGAAPSDPPTI